MVYFAVEGHTTHIRDKSKWYEAVAIGSNWNKVFSTDNFPTF